MPEATDEVTTARLASELAHYYGTEDYHRATLVRSFVVTDGVLHFAKRAQAFWFLDIIASELIKPLRAHGFLVVTMHVRPKGPGLSAQAEIAAAPDKGVPPVWTKAIDYTSCPLSPADEGWRFFFAPGGPQGTNVLMLPSEY